MLSRALCNQPRRSPLGERLCQRFRSGIDQFEYHELGGLRRRTARCRTVANTLSIGFDVRRWSQCSAGKSKKASSASRNAPYFYARTRALGRQIWWFVTLLFAVLVITSTINEYNVPNVVEVRPVTTDD